MHTAHALNEQLLWIIAILMTITLIIVITMFYLMLVKPDLWLEWFVNRPYRWWGMQVKIVDQERFRKATRYYAAIPILFAFIALLVSLFICFHRKIF